MNSFKDEQDRDWTIRLSVGLIEDAREKIAVDLDALIQKPDDIATLLFLHPRKFVELLYVLCEQQIEERKVTPKQFGNLFTREVLDSAVEALMYAIVDFYPRTSAGKVLKEKLPALLAKMDKTIDEKTRQNIEKELARLN